MDSGVKTDTNGLGVFGCPINCLAVAMISMKQINKNNILSLEKTIIFYMIILLLCKFHINKIIIYDFMLLLILSLIKII
jgi:hypothetical protein